MPVTLGMTITQEQADNLLLDVLNGVAQQLMDWITHDLSQPEINALSDFCYNLGVGAFRGSSLHLAINTGQPVTEDLFTVWDKAHQNGQLVALPGLKARRLAEYHVWLMKESV